MQTQKIGVENFIHLPTFLEKLSTVLSTEKTALSTQEKNAERLEK